ncbi:MAG: TonB-dependent receptor, partial [Bacteroidota bacterium]
DAVWETTTQFNIGADFGFVDNRIGVTLDYYIKETNDLLLNRPLAGTSGFAAGVLENIGDMRNSGFEASLTFVPIQNNKVNWSVTLFGAINDNEVVALFDDQPIDRGFATRIAVGQPLGSFFGLQTDGIYQNMSEIERDNALNPDRDYIVGAQPGDFRFVDQLTVDTDGDGIPDAGDGIINNDDRTFIGSALPDFTGGVENRLTIGGLDVNFFFQFNFGNEVYNNNLAFAEGLNSVFAPTVRSFEGAWREEGDGDDIPTDPTGDGITPDDG